MLVLDKHPAFAAPPPHRSPVTRTPIMGLTYGTQSESPALATIDF